MAENNFSQFFYKKAYEISYAIFRIGAAVKHRSFGEEIASQGLFLLTSAAKEDCAGARVALRAVEGLLNLGADVNLVNYQNAQLVLHEVKFLNSAIAEFQNAAKAPVIDLDGVFSKLPISPEMGSTFAGMGIADVQDSASREATESAIQPQSGKSPENRQSAILERIRQLGNCRLPDLQKFLPETSDRTLRYDLQNLMERGLVERVGKGGPATYYRVKSNLYNPPPVINSA